MFMPIFYHNQAVNYAEFITETVAGQVDIAIDYQPVNVAQYGSHVKLLTDISRT